MSQKGKRKRLEKRTSGQREVQCRRVKGVNLRFNITEHRLQIR